MKDEDLYWLALGLLPHPPVSVRSLHAAAGSAAALGRLDAASIAGILDPAAPGGEAALWADEEAAPEEETGPDWWGRVRAGLVGCAAPPIPGELTGTRLLEAAADEARAASDAGIEAIPLSDPRYPEMLAVVESPPPVLFARGDTSLLPAAGERAGSDWWSGEAGTTAGGEPLDVRGPVCLAVVGSRRASDYGRAVSRRIGRFLADRGAVVVSGLARGIDGEAHRGALDAGGRTIAVLGGGLSAPCVPRANLALADRIARGGLMLSEFPLATPAARAHFPRRNRIIAGLSAGVVVVEAASRSGALITARLALEEGREVFAVPGRITSPLSAGANGLIRAGAAALVSAEEDILSDLPASSRARLTGPDAAVGGATSRRADLSGLTPPEREIAALLTTDDPLPVDLIVARSRRSAGEVVAALVGLEIRGIALSLEGGRYLLAP